MQPIISSENVKIHYSPQERAAAGISGVSIALGMIGAIGGALALYVAAHGMHPSLFSHVSLNTLGIELAAGGGGLALAGIGGIAGLKRREQYTKQLFEKHKEQVISDQPNPLGHHAIDEKGRRLFIIVTQSTDTSTAQSPIDDKNEPKTLSITYDVYTNEKQLQRETHLKSVKNVLGQGDFRYFQEFG